MLKGCKIASGGLTAVGSADGVHAGTSVCCMTVIRARDRPPPKDPFGIRVNGEEPESEAEPDEDGRGGSS